MVARRLKAEFAARVFVIGVALGLPLAALIARLADKTIELRARVAEAGGWTPADLTAAVGQPLHLRLISDDVLHGFAIGQSDGPSIDVPPGQAVETTLTFDQPGKYVFYCTRWCGLGHWRMRGAIEVTGASGDSTTGQAPLYVTLGLNIDASHEAAVTPEGKSSAVRGAQLGMALPKNFLTQDYYRSHSPAEVWGALRAESFSTELTDDEVWDLVAFIWRSNTTSEALAEAKTLYAQNCAACHGEAGAGDGIAAAALRDKTHEAQTEFGHPLQGASGDTQAPVDFTEATLMLGASPALLQGKILRGGMGTGMPYWGPIFTEAQTWALVDYLWTFQFEYK